MATVPLDDFTGGLWIPEESSPTTEQPGFAVPANALLLAQNIEFLPSGGVKSRRGRTLYNSSSLGGAVRGLFRHYTRQGSAVTGPNDSTGGTTSLDIFGYPGTVGWSNPGNTATLDDNFASVALTDQISSWLVVPGFTSVIPGGATIVGVQMDVARRVAIAAASGQVFDFDVRLARVGGGDIGANRAVTSVNWEPRYFPSEPLPPFVYWTYGGPTDVWGYGTSPGTIGSPLVPADFNTGNNLALIIAVRGEGGTVAAEIDHVRLTVYYTDSNQSHRFLAAHVSSSNLVYKSGAAGVFSSITGGSVTLAGTSRPRFVNWPEKNATFLFDGMNAVRRYNGNIIEVVATGGINGVPPHRGPYATLWKDRLFASEPSESNFSVYASELFNETEWPPQAQLSMNDPSGGTITGIVGLLDRLVVLKNTTLWAFAGDVEFGPGQLTKYSDQGCVAPDSVQLTPYGIVFVGRDGVYLTDGQGSIPLELSRAIRPLWVGRNTRNVYTSAVAIYHPRTDRYIVNLDPGASNVCYALQRILIPNRTGQAPDTVFAWCKISPLPLNAAAVFGGESDLGELYTGDTSGSVFEADVGSTDPSAAAIVLDLLTSQRLFDTQGRRNGRIYQMAPLFRAASPASMAIRYDQDLTDSLTFATVGSTLSAAEEQEPRVYVSDKAEMGRFFSVRFGHSNAGGGVVEVHRIDVDFKLRARRSWRDPRPT